MRDAQAQHDAAEHRPAQRERETRRAPAATPSGQAELGRQLVRAIPEADRADEDQHRHPAKRAAVRARGSRARCTRGSRGAAADGERAPRRAATSGGENGAIVAAASAGTSGGRARARARRRGAGPTTSPRCAISQRDAERRRVLGLPRVVADEAEHDPRRAQQDRGPSCLQRAMRPGRRHRLGVDRPRAVAGRGARMDGDHRVAQRKRQPKLPLRSSGLPSHDHERAEARLARRLRGRGLRAARLRRAWRRSAGGTCRSGPRCP